MAHGQSTFFVNLSQGLKYVGTPSFNSDSLPTILRSSILVDIGRDAPDGGRIPNFLELFSGMVYPGFLDEGHDERNLPLQLNLGRFDCEDEALVSPCEVRELIGNGMHVASIGTWHQVVLSAVVPWQRHVPLTCQTKIFVQVHDAYVYGYV